ncbi:hypothetical protein BZA70DRAFT_291701 [Myxozyma melibiosi]|uniref:J domain-containing protein n=1 Tax=Myxozyma melibiosi TaxID=54550 RepID=A0ABR1EZ81_9ASCO
MLVTQLGSYIAWLTLPRVVSSTLQSYYYKTVYSSNPADVPRPGTPKHRRDQRISYALVIAAYFAYSTYKIIAEVLEQGNSYTVLGVPLDADAKAITRAFRELSRRVYPDKVGPGDDGRPWMLINSAKETLLDPVKRFAYDRFGSESLGWMGVKTPGDYIWQGLRASMPQYAISLLALVVLSWIGIREGGYWRFYALAVECVIELWLLTHSGAQERISAFFSYPITIHELSSITRRLLIQITIAGSQLGPVLFPRYPDLATQLQQDHELMTVMLNRLSTTAAVVEKEATAMFSAQTQPFLVPSPRGSANAADELYFKRQLHQQLVEQKLRSHPRVREAVGKAVESRTAAINLSRSASSQ